MRVNVGNKDGWPVGVVHSFVWHDQKIWITFASHRHRAEAIRRDSRVSVNVSGEPLRSQLPNRTINGEAEQNFMMMRTPRNGFIEHYQKRSRQIARRAKTLYQLDSPLRTIISVQVENGYL